MLTSYEGDKASSGFHGAMVPRQTRMKERQKKIPPAGGLCADLTRLDCVIDYEGAMVRLMYLPSLAIRGKEEWGEEV